MVIGIYLRVSTEEQAQQGFSIDHQKDRLEAYCKSQGWDEFRYYIDDGYTGTNMERPALKRMINHIREGKLQIILVYKLDRLGRKQKEVLYLLEDVFDKNNVAFKSATEPFDTATPLGKAMLGILAVFAQLERDTIIERTTAGRRQRVKKGMWHGGRVPFGYIWNKKAQHLEVNEEEADLVSKTFSMYLQGYSTLSIADWLSARNKSRVFDHSVVRDLLQRIIYTGRLHNANEIVQGNHKAIVDTFTFERVQKEMMKRKEGRSPIGEYLLTGMLRCGLCGGPVIHVIAKRHGKQYEYYACKAQHVRRKERKNNCSLGYMRKEKLDSWIIEKLKQISLSSEEINKEMNLLTENNRTDEHLQSELFAQLKKVQAKLEKWYDAFEQDMINPVQLKERIQGLEQEKKSILLRIEEMEVNKKQVNTETLFETFNLIAQSWDLMNFDEQKEVLRLAVEKLVLYPKQDPDIIWNV